MESIALIRDLAVAWLGALVFGSICVRLKLPVIAGYILAGVVIGPFGARLISESAQIKVLAELGVALLLFVLGVEISLRKVFAAAGKVTAAAACQILFTLIAGWWLGTACGFVQNTGSGIIFGFICALSSTAVVTKLLVDNSETETLHGRVIVPMLLIQDLALVPVVAVLPALQASSSGSGLVLAIALGKAALLMLAVMIGSLKLVPRLLLSVSRTNSRELFLLTVISLCLAVALLGKELGVSLALGAFLAGIMISERPYGHQVLADIMPLRDLFATLFFVSVGMLLNPAFIASHWLQVGIFVVVLMFGKAFIGAASSLPATRSVWSAILVGVGLAQIGEFSFVLATLGHASGLLSESLYNLFFAGAVITLAISPSLITATPELLSRVPAFRLFQAADNGESTSEGNMKDHLVLCGFGRMGREIGFALKSYGIPFVVIELNGEAIEELHACRIPFIYGDAFSHLVLTKANIAQASCLLLTVPDAIVSLNIINYARSLNPEIRIIARASRPEEMGLLRDAGANAVVQPAFEASMEATKLALISMRRSRHDVLAALREIRHRAQMIHRPQLLDKSFVEFPLQDLFGHWFIYRSKDGHQIGKLDVRKHTGATILALKREEQLISHPAASTVLQENDELYVAGDDEQMARFERSFPVARFCPVHSRTDSGNAQMLARGD